MDLELAEKIMERTVRDYDAISQEWGATRQFPRLYQTKAISGIKKGSKILDIGCGNGVLYDFLSRKSIKYVGLDSSGKLLSIAEKRIKKIGGSYKLVLGNITSLPFKDKKFDWVLALAVLHHIPSSALQKKAVEEMHRVLKPQGRAVVSVWNLYTDYADDKFKIREQLKKLPAGWSEKDLLVPWKATPNKIIQRYLYRFDKKELADLFKGVGFKKINVFYGDAHGQKTLNLRKSRNIVLTAEK
ncbi:MAG: class I SAM-dependent methyltransferase [Candidatus Magasanikbacteria bacterium]|nr:class I SAM-dependent methyltransferase [Candidatus Magasanikbacteria bacterium]